jgi:hypothetical protein
LGGLRVENGWSRGDDVERVAEDVGDDEGDELAGLAGAGESAAFDAAELLADGVQLGDVRALGAELAGERLFFGERETVDWSGLKR